MDTNWSPVYLTFHCRLVPAGDTEFAKDAAFGYKSSNLRDVKLLILLLTRSM